MNIKANDKGVYYINIYNPLKGYTEHKSLRTKDKKKASDELNRRKAEKFLGLSKGIQSKKFSEVQKIFFAYKKLRASTVKSYEWIFNLFILACGDKMLNDYSMKDYLKWKLYCDDLGHHQNTLRISNQTLMSLFHFGIKFNFCDKCPIENVKAKIHKVKVIPIKELKDRIEFIKSRNFKHYLYVQFTYLLALRPSEALYLKWEYFDLNGKMITIYNSKKDRFDYIPLIDDVEGFLNSIEIGTGNIFDYVSYDSIKTYVFKNHQIQYVKKHKDKSIYSLKLLRKTRGSELANMGVKPYYHMLFMRHTDIKTTYTYYTKADLERMRNDINNSLGFDSNRDAENNPNIDSVNNSQDSHPENNE